MDFSWLESTFHNSEPLKKEDCIVTFLHWTLLRNGFFVLHSKEGQVNVGDVEGKEILPETWKFKENVYELQYVKDGQLHVMKAVIVDGELALKFVRIKDEKISNLVLKTDTVIGNDFRSCREAFKDKVKLYNLIHKELVIPFMEKVEQAKLGASPAIIEKSQRPPSEVPSRRQVSTEAMLKTVRGILYKLTPSKFDALLARIQALDIDSEDRLAGVIKLFFEMAVDEPIFSSMYAKMCQALSTKEVASASNPSETTNFRKLLLTRCQKEFEKDESALIDVENKKKEIETAESDAKKKDLEMELEELVNSNRRKSLGNIRFIGELFKLRILSVKIMHHCILRLLSQPEDEESLECLCILLPTIGKELETPMQPPAGRSTSISANRESMNSYFSTLDSIVNKRKISNRIRFMIQDLVDLRKTGWKPRREDNNPKTIDQIHREVHKEREEQERELNNPQFQGPMGSMGGLSRDGRKGDRRGGYDRNRKQSRTNDDGWNTVQNSGSRVRNVKLDMKQLRIPKGVTGTERIWIMSNAPLTSIIPSGVDPNAFLAQNKELEFLSQIDSIPRSSGSVGKSSSNGPPSSQVYIEFQHSLEKYLRDASQLTTDDVCSWIQKQNVGEVNSAFIRALVTAVTESSIEGRGTDSKLSNTVLKHWTEVLRRYVDNIADRELQLLFAVQSLVTQRQHPKGLIQGIFETLYESNVVSEEGFESWVSVDDPLEREGKAVALKMITLFLKEADPESHQEADA